MTALSGQCVCVHTQVPGDTPSMRGTQRFAFLIYIKMFILKLQARKPEKLIASKYTISYQNKDFNKSNVIKVILS